MSTPEERPLEPGTPEFCGPEQFLASEVAHPANDVYALGVTIFLMMTGAFPFDGPREELPRLHFHQPPPGLVEALITRFGKETFDPRTLVALGHAARGGYNEARGAQEAAPPRGQTAQLKKLRALAAAK